MPVTYTADDSCHACTRFFDAADPRKQFIYRTPHHREPYEPRCPACYGLPATPPATTTAAMFGLAGFLATW